MKETEAKNERPHQIQISRRDFLLRRFKGSGSQITKTDRGNTPNELLISKPLEFGNLKLFALPIEHSTEDWVANQQKIVSVIDRFPNIIPEYFPPEFFPELTNHFPRSFLEVLEQANIDFFNGCAATCGQKGKNIWVVDPCIIYRILSVLEKF